MAGINLSSLILTDRWPGPVNPFLGKPTDGWDSTLSCFKTTSTNNEPKYPLGTKIMAYTDSSWNPGWYTMMYLMYHTFEGAVDGCDCSKDWSVGGLPACYHVCWSQSKSTQVCIAETSTAPYYVVTRCITGTYADSDYTRSRGAGPIAIPCWTATSDGTGAYAAGYGDAYGWFWVGGVCPAKDATVMDGKNAGTGSACAGIGACVSGSWGTKAQGLVYCEVSQAAYTTYLTCDISNLMVLTGDVSYGPLSTQPIGIQCMSAV